MLEGPLKSWITYFLGQYVESQSVNVSSNLWNSSEILKLKNLTLKKSIIPSWLPFRLKSGFIGQFEADLPISAIFGNSAAKIRFMDVLLILAPLQHDETEERDERELLIEQKLQHLEQDLVDRWTGPRVPEYTVHHESEGYFGTDGWIGRTMTKLIDNLQIDVRNLHIRIEGVWYPAKPPRSPATSASASVHATTGQHTVKFAAGLSLGALSAVTTPSNWRVGGFDEEKPANEKSHLVFKLINALDLSAYVDPFALHFIHSSEHWLVMEKTLARLRDMGSRVSPADWWNHTESVHAHRFVVAPIAVLLKLTMNTAAQHSQTEEPRYDALFHLSRVHMALDEEQLSVLNLVLESFSRHDNWRMKVCEDVKREEGHNARGPKSVETAQTYLSLWKTVMAAHKDGLEAVKKTDTWKQLLEIEKMLPFELIVSMRNQAGNVDVAGDVVPYESMLHDLGDAMGIPLPEISLTFPVGPTGLMFDVRPDSTEVTLSKVLPNSFAAFKSAIRPGLLLIKVDGKPLEWKTGGDVQMKIDTMKEPRVLTFRHPLAKPAEVTPKHLVSSVTLRSDELTFWLVRAAKRKPIANVALIRPDVIIQGFGPDLFSFHRYEVLVSDFYVQNLSYEKGVSHCIASSVCNEDDGSSQSALRLCMDYLHGDHPDAVPGVVSTYGSKISCSIGSSVLVFHRCHMEELLRQWSLFSASVSTNYGEHPALLLESSTSTTTIAPASMSSTAPTSAMTDRTMAPSSMSNAPPTNNSLPTVSSYSYDIAVRHLRMFVSASKKDEPMPTLQPQNSYRSLISELVKTRTNNSTMSWIESPRRRLNLNKIVRIQSLIRGMLTRRQKMLELARTKQLWMHRAGIEMIGWLYKRDDTLAFRRWHRVWCRLKQNGNFCVYDGPMGHVRISSVCIIGSRLTLVESAAAHRGASESRRLCVLEIRSHDGEMLAAISADNRAELECWMHHIENNSRANHGQTFNEEDSCEDVGEPTSNSSLHSMDESYIYSTKTPAPSSGPRVENQGLRHGAISEKFLLGGFSDVFQAPSILQRDKSNWITLSLTDFVLKTDVHRSIVPDHSAFQLYIGARFLTIADLRKKSNHGLLHIGDEFLTLRDGVLRPAKLRSDTSTDGPMFALKVQYRGSRASTSCFVAKRGLNLDLDITGWFMPMKFLDLIWDVLETIQILWTDPNAPPPSEDSNTNAAAQSAWYRVSELALHIQAPMLEAYVEDSHCVAKLTLEKSTVVYRADPYHEHCILMLGPTALFVLTNEVALRLAQADQLKVVYDMLFTRDRNDPQHCEQCKKPKDENAMTVYFHRKIAIAVGQVKLEADRRLELLYALLEAVTSAEPPPESECNSEVMHRNSVISQRGTLVHEIANVDAGAAAWAANDSRLSSPVPVYDHTFDTRNTIGNYAPHYSPSATRYNRMSGVSSQGHIGGASSSNQGEVSNGIMPLFYYQAYVDIIGGRRFFRPPRARRVQRFHDTVEVYWESIVFEVIKRSLSMLALDTYIPVINLSLCKWQLRLLSASQFTYDLDMDASIDLSARYYNSALADLEPFIEPWQAGAKYSWHGESSSAELSAMDRLKLNCTDALMRVLCSVAKSRKRQVFYVEKRSAEAVAADGESRKADGRVSVLNNLGVPIRLAKLNTFNSGVLHVEVRDGWSYPSYARFHDVRVEVVLLPWWYPREGKHVESIRHRFSLNYDGAQSGVTPMLRILVSSKSPPKSKHVYDHFTKTYMAVEGDGEDADNLRSSFIDEVPQGTKMVREDSSSSSTSATAAPKHKWYAVGTAEINLATSVMGSQRVGKSKLTRWYRLHDQRGNITGEISVALEFLPHTDGPRSISKEPKLVNDGQCLVFDPLKTVTVKKSARRSNKHRDGDNASHVILAESLRGSYIPPLALEVIIGNRTASLVCPMRRAGKFLIRGDKVLAEVKVAQRDETRRVLMLSSPVQLKNETTIEMFVWTAPSAATEGDQDTSMEPASAFGLKPNGKMSIPLDAMVEGEEHSVIVKVQGCKPTVMSQLGSLVAGARILSLEPEDENAKGYCLYVKTTSLKRKVYREEQQLVVTRGTSDHDEAQSYETKYQIVIHSCLIFENTLPVRVQYAVVTHSDQDAGDHPLTLSPGEEVNLHEFQKGAQLLLRLPDMDSLWCKPISLGNCIYRKEMGHAVKTALDANDGLDQVIEFKRSPQASNMVFKDEDAESSRIFARLDYSSADDGSPRVVLYSSLWVYNHSHIDTLLLRSTDVPNAQIMRVPKLMPEREVPHLMDCASQVFEVSTIAEHEEAKWSDRIHSNVVGNQGPISLKFGGKLGKKRRHEIGVSIQRPRGRFHRTTQVIITPRFVFVNKTSSTFLVSSTVKDSNKVMELKCFDELSDVTPQPFDFEHNNLMNREVFIRMDHSDAQWSGPFSVDEEKEFPLRLRGGVSQFWKTRDQTAYTIKDMERCKVDLHRVKVTIRIIDATVVVTLMHDDPPMYVIRNESCANLMISQVNCPDESISVLPNEYLPFAWERPDGTRRITCRARSTGPQPKMSDPRYLDFANLDRERGNEDLKYWQVVGLRMEPRAISAEVVVDKSSRVLVFRDQKEDSASRKYVLEVKVSAVRMRDPVKLNVAAEMAAETEQNEEREESLSQEELEVRAVRRIIKSKEAKTKNSYVYRFDGDIEVASSSRPKQVTLKLFETTSVVDHTAVTVTVPDTNDPVDFGEQLDSMSEFHRMESPAGSPLSAQARTQPNSSGRLRRFRGTPDRDDRSSVSGPPDDDLRECVDVEVSDGEYSVDGSKVEAEAEAVKAEERELAGVIYIKIPRRAWTKFGVGHKRSIAWSHNNAELARRAFGHVDGQWWEMRHPETGDVVGEVQLALRFRTSVKQASDRNKMHNVSLLIPSIGISFLHSASSALVEVAYLSMQRIGMLYSQVDNSSEVIFSLGNIQIDNQMDSEVVLGPKVHRVKEGVSVRLRDRWRSCLNYRYRAVLEQLQHTDISVIQFRMLWNARCNAGDITHYEVIELIMQEVEISTDEKFVVNLITVFQGLEALSSHHPFDEIVNANVDFVRIGEDQAAAVTDGIYIEELNIESIRVKFSMELNGGRYVQSLGPSGRRLAMLLPESNVKDFRLYFTKLVFNHIYDSKAVVVGKLTRHYQQQAVLLVLRGLHTVSVYANPFRIVYRLGHGFLEIVRLPARGLASGSPVELVSGAYLGVRSLAMNTISASYEIVAGASGILAAVVAPLLPEAKRKLFQDDMIAFQRAIMEEVDSFDAAEERTMTKLTVRKPREFDPQGVGLLTAYGPGSLPQEEQDRIDSSAILLLQAWWRRRRKAHAMYAYALSLSPSLRDKLENGGGSKHMFLDCVLQ
ncbi:TPA: hypothetical protein N0F65_004541 [Lagenidium giganteum]|uniref:PH domain-containing protein n=1 Tax=Lagenidium giganteum TaxID=4803 RepID=A0AAV2Z8W8_9STRA|nr:TPA: hypothetical protein N0F65_004541 [Lagenidium giganteum]